MTAYTIRVVELACDDPGCNNSYGDAGGSETVPLLRKNARLHGWRLRLVGGKFVDVCPKHPEKAVNP